MPTHKSVKGHYDRQAFKNLQTLITLLNMASGFEIQHFDTLSSTNDLALELAKASAKHLTVIIADAQTAGRGRFDHKWHSPKGKNIYMSIILKDKLSPSMLSSITPLTAVACVRGIKELCPKLPLTVKWHNDLYINSKKLGGILTESRVVGNSVEFVVVGIGINVNATLEDFPHELRHIATSIRLHTNCDCDKFILTEMLLKHFDKLFEALPNNRIEILQAYKELVLAFNQPFSVMHNGSVVSVKPLDITQDFCLIAKRLDTEEVINVR